MNFKFHSQLTFPFKGVIFVVFPVVIFVTSDGFHQVEVLWPAFCGQDGQGEEYSNDGDVNHVQRTGESHNCKY